MVVATRRLCRADDGFAHAATLVKSFEDEALLVLRSRSYDPSSGRFLTLDPFAGSLEDPQSLHKYLYVHANPINAIDPSGQFLLPAIGIGLTSLAFGGFFTWLGDGGVADFVEGLVVGAELSLAVTLGTVRGNVGSVLADGGIQGMAAVIARWGSNRIFGKPNVIKEHVQLFFKSFASGAMSTAITGSWISGPGLTAMASILNDIPGLVSGKVKLGEAAKNAILNAAVTLIVKGAVRMDVGADATHEVLEQAVDEVAAVIETIIGGGVGIIVDVGNEFIF